MDNIYTKRTFICDEEEEDNNTFQLTERGDLVTTRNDSELMLAIGFNTSGRSLINYFNRTSLQEMVAYMDSCLVAMKEREMNNIVRGKL